MTGQEHFHRAEELAAEARKLLGQGEGQATAAAWAAVAQVHATLALAAASLEGPVQAEATGRKGAHPGADRSGTVPSGGLVPPRFWAGRRHRRMPSRGRHGHSVQCAP
jgi:hypothetical protein